MTPPPPPTPPPRNRRAEDPRFTELLDLAQQNHELMGITAARVTELAGKVDRMAARLAVVERTSLETRKVQEDFGVDELNPKQRRGLPELLEWWDEKKDDEEGKATRLAHGALWGNIIQTITAVLVFGLAVYTLLSSIKGSTPRIP